ncbi:MAG: dihydroorotase [Coriobacteriia bacterium]|nr:dihydroorotase [Coriobacteriia bacterium]
MPTQLLLRGGRLVDPAEGLDAVADVLVGADGAIAAVGDPAAEAGALEVPKGATVIECAEKVVLPGPVDVHVHLREPGREDEETVATGTRAAARGGFTAVCAMPNTDPAIDDGAAVRALLESAERDAAVRVHPVGALTRRRAGEALAEIGEMAATGAVAFTDDGSWLASSRMMRMAMDYTKRFGVPVLSHAEDPLARGGAVNEGEVSTLLGLPGWPSAAEETAVARDIRLCELTGCRLHVQHLSTAGSLELVRRAKAAGMPVTCEVTPHHLFLDETALLQRRYDTALKMNPPLRTSADREALVAGLTDGTVDCVATDHAPHAAHEKEMEFELAPYGVTGLETALPLLATRLVAPGTLSWADVARLLCHGPRSALGLPEVRLAAGFAADLTVFDPEARVEVGAGGFESRSANSPWTGERLLGRATEVLVGGKPVVRSGKVVA